MVPGGGGHFGGVASGARAIGRPNWAQKWVPGANFPLLGTETRPKCQFAPGKPTVGHVTVAFGTQDATFRPESPLAAMGRVALGTQDTTFPSEG